jgi:hypothetical protein
MSHLNQPEFLLLLNRIPLYGYTTICQLLEVHYEHSCTIFERTNIFKPVEYSTPKRGLNHVIVLTF